MYSRTSFLPPVHGVVDDAGKGRAWMSVNQHYHQSSSPQRPPGQALRAPLRPINQDRVSAQPHQQDPAQVEKLQKMELFRRDLDEQVRLKQERKRLEEAQLLQLQRKEQQDSNNYFPWGREGNGAPLRNSQGDVLADLRHMDNNHSVVVALGQRDLVSPTYRQQQILPTLPIGSPHMVNHFQPSAPAMQSPFHPSIQSNRSQPPESGRFSRFRFGAAGPEEQDRLNEKLRKQNEMKRLLEEQMQEKRRRKETERRLREEEEKREEERLAREQSELQQAYDREKGRLANKKHAQEEYHRQLEQQQKEKEELLRQQEKEKQPQQHLYHNQERRQHQQSHTTLAPPSPIRSIPRSPVGSVYNNSPPPPIRPIGGGGTRQSEQFRHHLQGPSLADLVPARISQIRQELLGEHDSLRRQIRRQEDTLRELREEVARVRSLGDKLSRRRPLQSTHTDQCCHTHQHQEKGTAFATAPPVAGELQSKSLFVPAADASVDPIGIMLESSGPNPEANEQSETSYHPKRPLPQLCAPRCLSESMAHRTAQHEYGQQKRHGINDEESTQDLDRLLQDFLYNFDPTLS